MAKNNLLSKIMFEIDHSVVDPPKSSISTVSPQITERDGNHWPDRFVRAVTVKTFKNAQMLGFSLAACFLHLKISANSKQGLIYD